MAKPLELSYAMMLELSAVRDRFKCTYNDLATWIKRLLCLDTTPSGNSVERKIKEIKKEKSRLRGDHIKQKEYLQTMYVQPCPPAPHGTAAAATAGSTVAQHDGLGNAPLFPTLAQMAAKVLQDSYKITIETKVPLIVQVEEQLKRKSTELRMLEQDISKSNETLNILINKTGKYCPKNVYRRDKRHENTRKLLSDASNEIKALKLLTEKHKQDRDNALKVKSKWKRQASKQTLDDGECSTCREKKQKISLLKDRVDGLEWENTRLTMDIEDLKEAAASTDLEEDSAKAHISTKQGRQYKDNVRQVFMELLSLGVAVGKVSKVVKIAVEGLTDLQLDNLPSKSLTSNLQTEAQIVSQMHMADILLGTDKATIHLDGTKKKFREYGSYQVSVRTPEGPQGLCLGIEEMATGEAKAYLDTMMNLFSDIAETVVQDPSKVKNVTAQLISSVKNTMTDRHIVNHKFKKLFEEARTVIFEEHLEDFAGLNTSQKRKMTELHSFFCGLHVLANMGTVAGKALKAYEDIALVPGAVISNNAFNKGNSRTLDLIFEVSQATTRTGNQRSGSASNWEDFLAARGVKNHIISFLHHRFNVLFTNGGAIYYHLDHLSEFLGGYNLNENRLLLCIGDTIKSPVCIAAIRALGLIATMITLPLWTLLEREKNTHILHLNPRWLHLLCYLRELSIDATPLLAGNSVFPDVVVRRKDHEVHELLLSETSDDITLLTKECLEILCFNMETLVDRQLKDQLPGGIYHLPGDDVIQDAASCPTSNRIGERDFSDVDREVGRAPQKATAHHSSSLTFRNNKTSAYLNTLPKEERRKIFKKAIELGPRRRTRNRERIKSIQVTRQKMMREHKAKKDELLRKAAERKQQLLSRIAKLGGVWTSVQQMESALGTIPTLAGKTVAVKAQLSFHRRSCNKLLTAFSSQGQHKPLEELQQNLKTIISNTDGVASATPTEPATGNRNMHGHVRERSERSQLITAHKVKVNIPAPVKSTKTNITTKSRAAVKKAKKLLVKAKVIPKPKPSTSTTCGDKVEMRLQFSDDMIHQFVAVGFENTWYLGEILSVKSPDQATIKYMSRVSSKVFQWPVIDDVKDLYSCFVVSKLLNIAPRDSGLRFWQLEDAKSHLKDIDTKYSALVASMGWN